MVITEQFGSEIMVMGGPSWIIYRDFFVIAATGPIRHTIIHCI